MLRGVGRLSNIPLWKPYMLSWRTKEEILVCLKYCLWQHETRIHFDHKGLFNVR